MSKTPDPIITKTTTNYQVAKCMAYGRTFYVWYGLGAYEGRASMKDFTSPAAAAIDAANNCS